MSSFLRWSRLVQIMNPRKFLILSLSVAAFSLTAFGQVGVLPKNDVRLKEVTDPKFHIGDVWEYKTRSGEEHSRLTILRIESSPELGIILHVAVDNLTWKDCQDNAVPESVPHMPFARQVVDGRVIKRISNEPVPEYRDGYENWKEAYSSKRAGIYVIAVRDAVSVAEKTWRSGIGCE